MSTYCEVVEIHGTPETVRRDITEACEKLTRRGQEVMATPAKSTDWPPQGPALMPLTVPKKILAMSIVDQSPKHPWLPEGHSYYHVYLLIENS